MSNLTIAHFFEEDLAKISGQGINENKLQSMYRFFFKKYSTANHKLCNDLWVYNGIICPHCLLYIDFSKLSLDCPYCNYTHEHKFNSWARYFNSVYVRVQLSDLHMLLFSHCINCNAEIILFACPECGKDIDINNGEYNPAKFQGKRNAIARGRE